MSALINYLELNFLRQSFIKNPVRISPGNTSIKLRQLINGNPMRLN